ncbi:MAG: biotin/lipoyl-binding protein [Isosphaeraceae bacterium]
MRWRVAIGLVASSAVLAGIGWLWASAAGPRSRPLRLPGVVEIQEVRLASKQGGRVKEIHVVEGQWVDPGQEIVSFEAPELAARLGQLRAQRDSIQVELDKADTGSRLQEIEAAAARPPPPGRGGRSWSRDTARRRSPRPRATIARRRPTPRWPRRSSRGPRRSIARR